MQTFFPGLTALQNIHPMFVRFPIVFFLGALAMVGIALSTYSFEFIIRTSGRRSVGDCCWGWRFCRRLLLWGLIGTSVLSFNSARGQLLRFLRKHQAELGVEASWHWQLRRCW